MAQCPARWRPWVRARGTDILSMEAASASRTRAALLKARPECSRAWQPWGGKASRWNSQRIRIGRSGSSLRQADRHCSETHSGGVEHGVRNGRSYDHDGGFPGAGGGKVGAVEQVDVQLGHVLEARDLVFSERGIQHFTVLKAHLFAQGGSETHDDRALHVGERILRI